MRAIKFRAWNKEAEVMHNWDEIGKVLHAKYFDDWISEGGIELMQYTGLHDIKGKEVYEGDIVKTEYHWDEDWRDKNLVVKYEDGSFFPWGTGDWEKPSEGWEIVGNVYENPELLK